jgi:hypothetical protein
MEGKADAAAGKHGLEASDLFPMSEEKRARHEETGPNLVAMREEVASNFFDAVSCEMGSSHFFTRLSCGHGFHQRTLFRIIEVSERKGESFGSDTEDSEDVDYCAQCPSCKRRFSRTCIAGSIGPRQPADRISCNVLTALRKADDGSDPTLWRTHDADQAGLATVRSLLKEVENPTSEAALQTAFYELASNAEVMRLARHWQPMVWLYRPDQIFKSGASVLYRALALFMHGFHSGTGTVAAQTRPLTMCLCKCDAASIMSEILSRVNSKGGITHVESWTLGMLYIEDAVRRDPPYTELVIKTKKKIALRFLNQAAKTASEAGVHRFFDEHQVREMHAADIVAGATANRMLKFTMAYTESRAAGKVMPKEFWV